MLSETSPLVSIDRENFEIVKGSCLEVLDPPLHADMPADAPIEWQNPYCIARRVGGGITQTFDNGRMMSQDDTLVWEEALD